MNLECEIKIHVRAENGTINMSLLDVASRTQVATLVMDTADFLHGVANLGGLTCQVEVSPGHRWGMIREIQSVVVPGIADDWDHRVGLTAAHLETLGIAGEGWQVAWIAGRVGRDGYEVGLERWVDAPAG